MAQYEVSILEKHPSCDSEQANKKSFRNKRAWLQAPTLLNVEMVHEETRARKKRARAHRLLCPVLLCYNLKEPKNVA